MVKSRKTPSFAAAAAVAIQPLIQSTLQLFVPFLPLPRSLSGGVRLCRLPASLPPPLLISDLELKHELETATEG